MSSEENTVTVELSHVRSLAVVLLVGVALGFSSGFLASTGMSVQKPVNTDDGSNNDGGPNTVSLDSLELTNEPSLGDAGAPIKIVEYTDYGCPFCAEWAGIDASAQLPIDKRKAFQQVKQEYIDTGKAEFIIKDYPAHPNSMKSHIAANCVLEQDEDAYWEYHDSVMEQRDRWMKSGEDKPDEALPDMAGELGIDMEQFKQCYTEGDNSEIMNDVRTISQAESRVGTPTFFIGNKEKGFIKISGAQPFSKFQEAFNKVS